MQGKGLGKGQAKGGKGAKPGAGQRKAEGGAPLRRQITGGFVALVGKNSRQNEEVTFHQAASNDLWLHARGVPGAHVIIKSGGRPVSEAAIGEAAALAAYYSQSRAAGTVPVDVTEQRYVRHMKGGGPGMVIYEREYTLHAVPADVAAL
jgi:predicted ribosome quality control (RQC) complex YloA/Tae2 family protein